MDSFAGNFPLLIIALFECLAISYVYGIKRFSDDIELMTGSRPGLYWLICWKYISPMAMITILTASFIELMTNGSTYPAWDAVKGITESKEWPHWCIVLAIFLILVSVLWIPIVALTRFVFGFPLTIKYQITFSYCRFLGFKIIEDSESAFFPATELREVYGIVPHEATPLEVSLFCINPDGSEGLCCASYTIREEALQEEN